MIKSCKGQRTLLQEAGGKTRRRGGGAPRRGMSVEHDGVLVVHDRSGATTDQIVLTLDTARLAAVLQPLSWSTTLSTSVPGNAPWGLGSSITSTVHSRLKNWLRRFNDVASSYLRNYLGWFRTLDRFSADSLKPASLLALAVEVWRHPYSTRT